MTNLWLKYHRFLFETSHTRNLPTIDGTFTILPPSPSSEGDTSIVGFVLFNSPGMRVNGDFIFEVEIFRGSAGMQSNCACSN